MYFIDHIRILKKVAYWNDRGMTPSRARVTSGHQYGGAYVDQLVNDGLLNQTEYIQRTGHLLTITDAGRVELESNLHRVS